MASLLKEERQELILNLLRNNRQVTVSELSERFDVSEVTIRRDLRELAEQGHLQRAHGGAVAPPEGPPDPPVVQRMNVERPYKEAIARATLALIEEGETIFIGAGSTTAHLARQLTSYQDLTVVTNALNIANELVAAEGVTIVVTGGILHKPELSLIGHIADQALREVLVDKVIIAIPAISLEAGLTNDYLPEVMTDRSILKMADELILVADYTKFGRVEAAFLAPIEQVTTLVTDERIDAQTLEQLQRRGLNVIVAEVEKKQTVL
ncbi:MAG: DeoR/GlpR family DNA-binding transcription regulator [Anaerolineae bacterium]